MLAASRRGRRKKAVIEFCLMRHLPLIVVVCLQLSRLACSATIVSVSGPLGTGYALGGKGVEQALEAGWTASQAYSDVSISAEVGSPPNPFTLLPRSSQITAYLTTRIGPAETVGDQIASVTFTTSTEAELRTLFTGLSLAPGTYYLALTGAYTPEQVGTWYGTRPPVILSDTGVSFLADGIV